MICSFLNLIEIYIYLFNPKLMLSPCVIPFKCAPCSLHPSILPIVYSPTILSQIVVQSFRSKEKVLEILPRSGKNHEVIELSPSRNCIRCAQTKMDDHNAFCTTKTVVETFGNTRKTERKCTRSRRERERAILKIALGNTN